MQIKIEIDVKPEELRRFLGLPDVAGLQEELIQFLRGKLGSAGETLDPSAFVRSNIELLRKTPAWKKVMETIKPREGSESAPAVEEPPASAARRSRRRGETDATPRTRRKRKTPAS